MNFCSSNMLYGYLGILCQMFLFMCPAGAEEKTNVELIVPIGSVVIAMFFWLLIVFVIRGRKKVRSSSFVSLSFFYSHALFSLNFPWSNQNMKQKNANMALLLWGCGVYDWLEVTVLALSESSPLCSETACPLSAHISHVGPTLWLGPFYEFY